MKRIMLGVLLVLCSSMALGADKVQVATYGGSYLEDQQKAWFQPFEDEYGIEVVTTTPPMGKLAKIKAEHMANNFATDAADLTAGSTIKGCEQKYLEPIGHMVDESKYIEGSIKECGIAFIVFSTNITIRPDQTEIRTPEDFFNPDIPGKRGMPKQTRHVFEMALLADGVDKDKIYSVLRTEEGRDRAFNVLDRIKDRIIWFEANQQGPQLVMNGEVVASLAYNGRVAHYTQQGDAKGMQLMWDDGFVYAFSYYGVSSGAPNKEAAIDFVKYVTGPKNNDFAKYSTYAPVRKERPENLSRDYPTHPDNLPHGVLDDGEFWSTYGDSIEERFSAWRAN